MYIHPNSFQKYVIYIYNCFLLEKYPNNCGQVERLHHFLPPFLKMSQILNNTCMDTETGRIELKF